jgi:hypothetical protein
MTPTQGTFTCIVFFSMACFAADRRLATLCRLIAFTP